MAVLGEGVHEVYIVDRGGTTVIGEVTGVTFLRWSRVRDDISGAEVRVASPDARCCDLLTEVRTVRHELVITRDGERVWEGPITRLEFEGDTATIVAADIAWYLSRTALENDYNYTGSNATEVTAALDTILKDHLPVADPDGYNIRPHMARLASPGEARTAAEIKAWSKTVWQQMDDFAAFSGIDYTVVGRRLVWFDVHLRILVLPMMTSALFGDQMRIVEYGSELKTRIVRNGQQNVTVTTGPQKWIDYYGTIDYVERLEEEDLDSQTGQDVTVTQQQGTLDSSIPAPQRVVLPANSRVDPSAPVPINEWVPGAWAILQARTSCRVLESWHKVDAVRVVADPGGEVVSVSFGQAPMNPVDPT